MKRIFSLTIAILFLLNGFAAFADVVFAPESDFYDAHRKECTRVERDYYSNGEKGYIALYKKPDGAIVDYLKNAQRLHIFCTYEDWGMISYLNGTAQEVDKWVKMSELYLIYDEQSFCEESADKITQSEDPLTLPEGTESVYLYNYPGAEDPNEYTWNVTELQATTRYTDTEGRVWGKIYYYQGIRNQWICFSAPTKVIPPFGGDPNLKTFEKYSANIKLPAVDPEPSTDPDTEIEEPLPNVPDPETDDPVVSVPETDSGNDTWCGTEYTDEAASGVIMPAEPPLRIPMDPLLIVAIVLVVLAVAAAIVLIIVCYKRKR